MVQIGRIILDEHSVVGVMRDGSAKTTTVHLNTGKTFTFSKYWDVAWSYFKGLAESAE